MQQLWVLAALVIVLGGGAIGIPLVDVGVEVFRAFQLLPENGIIVKNRDYINNVNEDRVLIAEDGLSFKNPSGKVIISMDGDFAYGVEKLMRKAVNDYEYV